MGVIPDYVFGGFSKRPVELIILVASRGSGKSQLDNFFIMNKPKFKIHGQAKVDGATWYAVGCSPEASTWIRGQDKTLFYEHIDQSWQLQLNRFDIHEKLYSMLALKWS